MGMRRSSCPDAAAAGCHPADAAALMALARESLDLEDADVQFLFRRYALPSLCQRVPHLPCPDCGVFLCGLVPLRRGGSICRAAGRLVLGPNGFGAADLFGDHALWYQHYPQEEGKSIPFANG